MLVDSLLYKEKLMILWINGAFGSGKTTIAQALANSYEKAHVYDPEKVGYFL